MARNLQGCRTANLTRFASDSKNVIFFGVRWNSSRTNTAPEISRRPRLRPRPTHEAP